MYLLILPINIYAYLYYFSEEPPTEVQLGGFPTRARLEDYNAKSGQPQVGAGAEIERDGLLIKEEIRAWDGVAVRIEINPTAECEHVHSWSVWLTRFLDEVKRIIAARIKERRGQEKDTEQLRGPQKIWVEQRVKYRGMRGEDDIIPAVMLSNGFTVITEHDIDDRLDEVRIQLETRNEKYTQRSDLSIAEILGGALLMADYRPLRTGKGFKPLPPKLANKEAIVNVKNRDDRCFGYALLAGIRYDQVDRRNRNRPSEYDPYFAENNLEDIEYPVAPRQVRELEERLGFAVNVFSFYDDTGAARYPLYISRYWQRREEAGEVVPAPADQKTYDLLYFDEHWAYIVNFSRFMSDRTKHDGREFWCKRCLLWFHDEAKCKLHAQFCRHADFCDTVYTMPA